MKRSLLDITQKISRNPGKTNLTPKDLTNSTYWIFEATGWRFVDILREIQYRINNHNKAVFHLHSISVREFMTKAILYDIYSLSQRENSVIVRSDIVIEIDGGG